MVLVKSFLLLLVAQVVLIGGTYQVKVVGQGTQVAHYTKDGQEIPYPPAGWPPRKLPKIYRA